MNQLPNAEAHEITLVFQCDGLKLKGHNEKRKSLFISLFHTIPLLSYVLILCELTLDPSAHTSCDYRHKRSGVEIERLCAFKPT